MTFSRRRFIASSIATAAGSKLLLLSHGVRPRISQHHEASLYPPTFSVIPVVGDGKWISKDPPKDKTGYYDPREFDVSVGIRIEGKGTGGRILASTVAPVNQGEQIIKNLAVETVGCEARLVPLTNSAGQLVLQAPSIEAGQVITANANYRIQISKSYMGYEQAKVPFDQKEKALPENYKRFIKNSPGIKVTSRHVKEVFKTLVSSWMHPWAMAETFYTWVWENIKGVPGRYTSVDQAIRKKAGDCEERASVFIALCRLAVIPARQVWVPSHMWAEFGLHDEAGKFHWIPVHTASYSWFGWTGVHELVLQKGDAVNIPTRKKTLRLIDDWYRMEGARAKFSFTTELTPVAEDGVDPGPGGRVKLATGQWKLTGEHSANKFHRNT